MCSMQYSFYKYSIRNNESVLYICLYCASLIWVKNNTIINFILDQFSYWHMCYYAQIEPAPESVLKLWRIHTWYLDPPLVVIVLASKDSNKFAQMEEMAKVLFVTERKPLGRDRVRAEMPPMYVYLKEKEKPP